MEWKSDEWKIIYKFRCILKLIQNLTTCNILFNHIHNKWPRLLCSMTDTAIEHCTLKLHRFFSEHHGFQLVHCGLLAQSLRLTVNCFNVYKSWAICNEMAVHVSSRWCYTGDLSFVVSVINLVYLPCNAGERTIYAIDFPVFYKIVRRHGDRVLDFVIDFTNCRCRA